MVLLHIETSTNVCSVALSIDSECVFTRINDEGMNHAELLSPFIDEAIQALKQYAQKPDAVVVSGGPGSYTGLRIGVSTAKGLCYGWNVPLIALNSLEVMFEMARKLVGSNSEALFCPMIDALRMEAYTCFFNANGETVRSTSADIIDDNSYNDLLSKQIIYFFGNGADKCKNTLTHPNARFIEQIVPKAEMMIRPAMDACKKGIFADVAYYEPFYLKEFYTTAQKKNIL